MQNFVKKKNAPRLIGNDNVKDITNSTTCWDDILILINAISLLHDRSMSISLLSYINLTYHPSGYKKYFEIVVIKLLYRKIFDKNLIDFKGTITFTT